ncbi:MAG: peptidoglycan-binding protein, partial [Pseudomonadota bacterium]
MSVFTRTLRYQVPMMTGADVRALQAALHDRGFGTRAGVDGVFGPATRGRVSAFQRGAGLDDDGIAGPATFGALAAQRTEPVLGPIPDSWLSPVPMRRIILHWTVGRNVPSASDLACYHIVIAGDGTLHRGHHSIADNAPVRRGRAYAAHCRSLNSHSIGVAVCAMVGARQIPFDAGSHPMTEAQWRRMAEVAAQLAAHYAIPISPETILGHGEVQRTLGVAQSGKWDPLGLPWAPHVGLREAGDLFRAEVRAVTERPSAEEPAAPADVTLDARPLMAARIDGEVWVTLASIAEEAGWTVAEAGPDLVDVGDPPIRLGTLTAPDQHGASAVWVDLLDVVEALNLTLEETADGALRLTRSAATPETVVVRRGQTLAAIATRWLGDATRWRELRDAAGAVFSEETARSLRIGQIVKLPSAATPTRTTAPLLGSDRIARIAAAVVAAQPSWLSTEGRDTVRRSVIAILEACDAEEVSDAAHQAYILATAEHETNLGRNIVEIWRPTDTQRGYVGRLGNRTLEEAKRYRGRGFVQITGRSNYARYGEMFDAEFVDEPDQVADPDIAAQILVRGLAELGFTRAGFVLADLGVDGAFDFVGARRLVNGDVNRVTSRYGGRTHGEGIAESALS